MQEKGNRSTARASGIILVRSGRSENSSPTKDTASSQPLRLFLPSLALLYITHRTYYIHKLRFSYARLIAATHVMIYIIYIHRDRIFIITCRPRAGPNRLENRFSFVAAVWFLVVYDIMPVLVTSGGVRRHYLCSVA